MIVTLFSGGHAIRLSFTISPSDFLLLYPSTSAHKYKVQILSFELEVIIVLKIKIILFDQVGRYLPGKAAHRHVEKQKSGELTFPFCRTVVRRREVAVGMHDVLLNRIMDSGQLPYSLVVVLVENYQFYSPSKNPFCWKPNNLEEYNLLVDGVSRPLQPMKIDPAGYMSARAYKQTFRSLGWGELSGRSPGIDPLAWLGNKFFLSFDLTDCGCAGWME